MLVLNQNPPPKAVASLSRICYSHGPFPIKNIGSWPALLILCLANGYEKIFSRSEGKATIVLFAEEEDPIPDGFSPEHVENVFDELMQFGANDSIENEASNY